ncbi:GntR family transcriptional regulator [Paraburkholderia caballeronis]|uniref:DNA-binding transcriptional regulator, GntR family n=1 Tax=Paraburkholderia caballeronis TaxID=416943 RepID=A0A1H7FMU9_9BURK|nr:GntR family transcriptional regulator [Paraburkholderia caballeronis]PXW24913.1 GntR family transcriptional regulator [Paraburkholderia caballeronis]PXX00643.1 GntR family transcriptional regulator [Paraburkholderia caballeronis]RAJ98706.1 GntR family transcriptional regulator [Paraburkholderia caballeronis]TDV16477.1 GntR family transcriptional regulator [Paraburkholderia caballeronis]TDV18873.1 GntR family transcriptional regulator [Paraburkholderia caballeronis]
MQNADIPAAQLAPALPKVERLRLHDTVVDHLRNFIVEGLLAPGVKLNERKLCEMLGISRTPLREALKVLAAEGLIDISPNRGASVAQLSEAEIRDMFELMSGLEAFAGELACERINAAELAEIKALHAAMLMCREQNDLSGYYARNRAIHDRINAAARNATLRQTYVTLNRRLQALRFRSNFQTAKWDSAIRDHEAMIRALETRDGRQLSAILRSHLLAKRDAVLAERTLTTVDMAKPMPPDGADAP